MAGDEPKEVEEGEEAGEEEELTDLSNSDVCTKYQEAARIVNLALVGLVEQCKAGAKVLELCEFGHTTINDAAKKLFTKKVKGQVVERGVAFPVCISVNDVVCNYSPLPQEEREPLKAGDLVKMDLGCHVDGYICVAAHTVIVPPEEEGGEIKAEPEMGNVAVAAYNAMLIAANAISAGAKNTDVTKAVERVADAYGVKPITSARMHQMKRYVLDGIKEIALKEPSTEEIERGEQLAECEFEQNEVYAVDVAMSTGDGYARPQDLRITVYKRNVETQYLLKLKASRALLGEVDKKFPTLPFTLRHLDDVRQARLGLNECVQHGLLQPYPCLHDHSGLVAHFKCTVLLLPSGTTRISGLELPSYFKTTKEPDEETARVLKEMQEEVAKKEARKAAKKNKKKNKN
jgi:curved DNA binding protein